MHRQAGIPATPTMSPVLLLTTMGSVTVAMVTPVQTTTTDRITTTEGNLRNMKT